MINKNYTKEQILEIGLFQRGWIQSGRGFFGYNGLKHIKVSATTKNNKSSQQSTREDSVLSSGFLSKVKVEELIPKFQQKWTEKKSNIEEVTELIPKFQQKWTERKSNIEEVTKLIPKFQQKMQQREFINKSWKM